MREVDIRREYLEALKKFKVYDGIPMHAGIALKDITELPELVQRILCEIKKEELTYTEASAALECAFEFLKLESNFVKVPR